MTAYLPTIQVLDTSRNEVLPDPALGNIRVTHLRENVADADDDGVLDRFQDGLPSAAYTNMVAFHVDQMPGITNFSGLAVHLSIGSSEWGTNAVFGLFGGKRRDLPTGIGDVRVYCPAISGSNVLIQSSELWVGTANPNVSTSTNIASFIGASNLTFYVEGATPGAVSVGLSFGQPKSIFLPADPHAEIIVHRDVPDSDQDGLLGAPDVLSPFTESTIPLR